ncbi:hypothetical protein GHT09_007150 [Marmota monax]|uniref:Uncharacterized protein n=1 Tax=Marmota monax TaxID=9995 RepID=A0A834QLD9_MARMO|nr:hypothetical protein GHT09_007150 [Marmota monax]
MASGWLLMFKQHIVPLIDPEPNVTTTAQPSLERAAMAWGARHKACLPKPCTPLSLPACQDLKPAGSGNSVAAS